MSPDCGAIEKYTIDMFSTEWYATNSISFSVILALLLISRSLKDSHLKQFTLVVGILLCFRVVFMQLYQYNINVWTFEKSIPLHLCGLSSILAGVVLLKKNQFAYECLFYWGLGGALQSFITPELNLGNKDSILYLDYFVSHAGIIFSALYLTIVLKMRPRIYSWFKVFLFSQILIPIIGGINYLINKLIASNMINYCYDTANYMYLWDRPEVDSPLIIGEWPYYILFVELIALANFWLLYQPIKLIKKQN